MSKVDDFNNMWTKPSGHFNFRRVKCHRCGVELFRQAGSSFTCPDCKKKRTNERAEERKHERSIEKAINGTDRKND
jgi:uncharacterized Zn finger protein (UPF0148 family)